MQASAKKQSVIEHIRDTKRRLDCGPKSTGIQKMQNKIFEELLLENKKASMQTEQRYAQQIRELKGKLAAAEEKLRHNGRDLRAEIERLEGVLGALREAYNELKDKHQSLLIKTFHSLKIVHSLTNSIKKEKLRIKLGESFAKDLDVDLSNFEECLNLSNISNQKDDKQYINNFDDYPMMKDS